MAHNERSNSPSVSPDTSNSSNTSTTTPIEPSTGSNLAGRNRLPRESKSRKRRNNVNDAGPTTGKNTRHVRGPALGRIRGVPIELTNPNPPARLSDIDRSPHLFALPPEEENGIHYQVFKGYKGYRSVRGTHAVCMDSWYYEVTVKEYGEMGAFRLGWATRSLDHETPVGFTEDSYSLLCQTGQFVHARVPQKYSEEGIKPGDTVGCLVVLPKSLSKNQQEKLKTLDAKWLKYYHVQRRVGGKPTPLNIDWDKAYVEFYKNGESLGIPEYFPSCPTRTRESEAPGKFPGALYFPCVSLFNDVVLKVNMGPKFKYGKPDIAKAYVETAPAVVDDDGVQDRLKKRAKKNGNGSSGVEGATKDDNDNDNDNDNDDDDDDDDEDEDEDDDDDTYNSQMSRAVPRPIQSIEEDNESSTELPAPPRKSRDLDQGNM